MIENLYYYSDLNNQPDIKSKEFTVLTVKDIIYGSIITLY